ncbi:MAG: hypothetical protein J2P53_03580 [Bradyrhizobiaceae bacterium]|nr:hypothetical protein [Bradyrhizobiaceae bacterium]
MAVATSRSAALAASKDLGQAGAVFNDATRLLDGGLWATPADSNNQPAYIASFTADIQSVLNTVNADLAVGAGGAINVGGNPIVLSAADVAALHTVQTNLMSMLANAANAANFNATAEAALHTADAAILNAINGDAHLAGAMAQAAYLNAGTGATDNPFQALNAGDANAAHASAPGATLAQIGNVFNAAADLAVGGLSANNGTLGQFTTDLQAISTGLQNILNSPTALAAIEHGESANAAALTTIHLQTVENQIQAQLNHFDPMYTNGDPNVAARGTNDNLLDIIDIIQNDTALNLAAGGNGAAGHVGGFAEMPGFLSGTTQKFVDNQAQTNFWAQFLAEANVINNELQGVANHTGNISVAALITQIQNYQKFGASFDASQGGIFDARFGNELLSGTLLTDSNAAVKALQDIQAHNGVVSAADAATLIAAGQGFSADAMDVSGNNKPVGGGSYVGSATTVASATSIAGLAQGTTNVGPVANGQTGLSSAAVATAPPPPTNFGGGFGGTPTDTNHWAFHHF